MPRCSLEVGCLIIGVHAVSVHGFPRSTGDLDIWLNPTVPNAERVLRVIFGFGSFNLTVADLIKVGNVIQFGQPPLRIDLLTAIDGVTFDACYANRKEVTFDGLTMFVRP